MVDDVGFSCQSIDLESGSVPLSLASILFLTGRMDMIVSVTKRKTELYIILSMHTSVDTV